MNRVHLRYGPPLLAASPRRWAGILLALCTILVVVLAMLFSRQATADRLDQAMDSPVITWFGGHRGLGELLISPGSLLPAALMSVAIAAVCLLTGRLNGAVLAAAAVPAADGLNDGLLKPLVHRTYLGVLTYPSGHTTAVFALAATVTVLLLAPPAHRKEGMLRVLTLAVTYMVAGVVAIALVGLRFHYFTDTVAGAALGIGTVCGLTLLLDLPAVRQRLAWDASQPSAIQERRGASRRASSKAST